MTGKSFRSSMRNYTQAINGVSQDIRVASRFKDKGFVRRAERLLIEAIVSARRVMEIYYVDKSTSLQIGSLPQEDLGKPWYEGSPKEILEDMCFAASYGDALILDFNRRFENHIGENLPTLEAERTTSLAYIASRIQIAKYMIIDKDPDFWTKAYDLEFGDWLRRPV